MFVKVGGKLQSLPFLPTSVKRILVIIVEDGLLIITLYQNLSLGAWTSSHRHHSLHHCESPCCPSEPSGWHSGPCIRSTAFKVQKNLLWENCKTEKVVWAWTSSLAFSPKKQEMLHNPLSQHGFSSKYMRWNPGSQWEFSHQSHPLYLRSK